FFDPYTQNRITGSFILIDPISNATLGAGMIREDLSGKGAAGGAESLAQKPVTTAERYKRRGHHPAFILVEDNPDLAERLERILFDEHFDVLRINDQDVRPDNLESMLRVTQSAGLVAIYSCDALAAETKKKLSVFAVNRFFDLSSMDLPADDSAAAQTLL